MNINDIIGKLQNDGSDNIANKMKIKSEMLKIQRRAKDTQDNMIGYIQDEINFISNNLNYGPVAAGSINTISDEDKMKLVHVLKCEMCKAAEELPEKIHFLFKDLCDDEKDEHEEHEEHEHEHEHDEAPVVTKEIEVTAEPVDKSEHFGY